MSSVPTDLGQRFIGNSPLLTATFQLNGVNTDPASIVLKYTSFGASRVVLTYGVDPAVIKTATGVYQWQPTLTVAGTMTGSWLGTWTGGKTANLPWTLEVFSEPNY